MTTLYTMIRTILLVLCTLFIACGGSDKSSGDGGDDADKSSGDGGGSGEAAIPADMKMVRHDLKNKKGELIMTVEAPAKSEIKEQYGVFTVFAGKFFKIRLMTTNQKGVDRFGPKAKKVSMKEKMKSDRALKKLEKLERQKQVAPCSEAQAVEEIAFLFSRWRSEGGSRLVL